MPAKIVVNPLLRLTTYAKRFFIGGIRAYKYFLTIFTNKVFLPGPPLYPP